MMGCCTAKPPPPPEPINVIKAALLIQSWYRRYLARMEVRRRYTWNIFQNLEYAAEQDQVELFRFFNALLTHMPKVTSVAISRGSLNTSKSNSIDNINARLSDESDYTEESEAPSDGPPLRFPLAKKDINILIDLFRKKKSNRLHAKQVGRILREATKRLKTLPNLNQASTNISKQITICGDLHGKLDDLLVIFHKNGLPSTENPYVFNGDFVDRGKKSLEVFLLLLTCLLVFPGVVFMNRGNHEDSVMNARYGFIREINLKYKRNADKLLTLIDEVYRWLPLGTIVDNSVLIVHGGISDTVDIGIIKSLDRSRYVSILRPPVTQTRENSINKVEWKQLFDIMWSDPQTVDGCIPNKLRGAGTYFGPDVTKNFLAKHKLKLLIRSHECKAEGYEFAHDNKVITIFSASNYYAIGSNRGAYMKLNPDFKPHFVQYVSAASKSRHLNFRDRVGLIEGSALRELGARLRDHRDDLEEAFLKNDPNNTGFISITQWCDSMENATNLGLPWRLLRDKLAPSTADSKDVNYLSTLQLLDTETIIATQAAETSVAESLYKNKSSLETIFHILDKDNSGHISLEEFGEACDLLQKHLPGAHTREQLLDMCRLMDINRDGFVDLNEFLEAFRLSEQKSKRLNSPKKRNNSRRDTKKVTEMANRLSKGLSEDHDIDPTDHEVVSSRPRSRK